MYLPYREVSKQKLFHTEICSFVQAHPLSVSDFTTPTHMSQASTPADCNTGKQITALTILPGHAVLRTTIYTFCLHGYVNSTVVFV
jgi:hypothetical protein